MSPRRVAQWLIVVAGLMAASVFAAPQPAAAQQGPVPAASGPTGLLPPRPRFEVYPRRLLYRRCTDWYELQHRPSGTVLFPQYHCWWVRG